GSHNTVFLIELGEVRTYCLGGDAPSHEHNEAPPTNVSSPSAEGPKERSSAEANGTGKIEGATAGTPGVRDGQDQTCRSGPVDHDLGANGNKHKVTPKVGFAIAYARQNCRDFPVHCIEADQECSCGKLSCPSAGKHPVFKGWQVDASTDEGQIFRWWKERPNANIGVRCGETLTVLDVDGDEGRDTLRELELEHGELPEMPIAHTGSGGLHYYFKFEPGLNNAVRFAPGLDVRTEGGFVVGVGSKTKGPYLWEAGTEMAADFQPAQMPDWLSAKIKAAAIAGGNDHVRPVVPDNAHAMVEGSGRNDTLYRLGRSLVAQNFPEKAIRTSLTETNRSFGQPLSAQEITALIDHVLTQQNRPNFQTPAIRHNGSQNGAVVTLKPLPAPLKAGEWFRQEETRFENASFIWDGILEAGAYAMVGGKKGHGKSTFARTLALKISRGEEFMGRATVRCRVRYLDFEPGGRGRIDTLRSLGWCDDDWLEFSTIPPPVNHPDVFKWLRQYIVERGFKVIIVDTLFKLLRIDGANDYDKGLYAQVPLEEICRELGVCIIVLHHARKNGQFSGQQSCAEQMLGATSIAGAACACILINHRGENYTFRMDAPRYGNAIEGELVLQRDVSGFVAPTGSWKKKFAGQTEQLVPSAAAGISDKPEWFVANDLQVTDPETDKPLSRRSIYWALAELVKDKMLEEGGKGKAPEQGGPLPASRKGGRPISQFRLVGTFSGVATTPAQEGLWR